MKRIVYAVATGKRRFGEMAMGLGRSLSLIGDPTPRVIVTDIEGFDWHRYFDEVLPPTGPRSALDKLTALERTDADQVLALDVDMLAFRRLEPIFDRFAGMDFGIQGHPETEGKFHGVPVPEILEKFQLDWMPRFNGGLAYYERKPSYEDLLTEMRRAESNYDQLGFEAFRGGKSEEVCMLMALIARQRFDVLVPMELQFQGSGSGLVGKLHLDVLKNEFKYVSRLRRVEFHEPFLFHAWRFKDYRIYWREIDKLEALERFEDRHASGYLSRWDRIRRSIDRRILRWRGRA